MCHLFVDGYVSLLTAKTNPLLTYCISVHYDYITKGIVQIIAVTFRLTFPDLSSVVIVPEVSFLASICRLQECSLGPHMHDILHSKKLQHDMNHRIRKC